MQLMMASAACEALVAANAHRRFDVSREELPWTSRGTCTAAASHRFDRQRFLAVLDGGLRDVKRALRPTKLLQNYLFGGPDLHL